LRPRRQGFPGPQRCAGRPLQLLLDEENQLLDARLRVLQLDAEGQADFDGILREQTEKCGGGYVNTYYYIINICM